MALNVTLAKLKTRVRLQADKEGSTAISDALLADFINASWAELYEDIVQSGLDYFEQVQTVATTGAASYALPSDYLGTKLVEYRSSLTSVPIPLRELMLQERAAYPVTGQAAVGYRVVQGNLEFFPTPPTGQTYLHRYVPTPAVLALDTDAIDGISGLEELIVVDVCRKIAIREEADSAPLERELARLRERVVGAIQSRAVTTPRHIVDVEEEGSDAWYWRRRQLLP